MIVFQKYDSSFLATSLDEAYLDITNVCQERGVTGEEVKAYILVIKLNLSLFGLLYLLILLVTWSKHCCCFNYCTFSYDFARLPKNSEKMSIMRQASRVVLEWHQIVYLLRYYVLTLEK